MCHVRIRPQVLNELRDTRKLILCENCGRILYWQDKKPMFDLLGTPHEHKELKLYETDHILPRNEFIKEILARLDRYLGPVNR